MRKLCVIEYTLKYRIRYVIFIHRNLKIKHIKVYIHI